MYVWAIRHPASGYVQGINDLVTPFFQVFLSAYVGRWLFSFQMTSWSDATFRLCSPDSDPELYNPSQLPLSVLNAIEADSFWCLSRLLDGIQDNYISAQPGIQRSVRRMAELVARIDGAPVMPPISNSTVDYLHKQHRYLLISKGRTWSLYNLPSDG